VARVVDHHTVATKGRVTGRYGGQHLVGVGYVEGEGQNALALLLHQVVELCGRAVATTESPPCKAPSTIRRPKHREALVTNYFFDI
jgi:hypothetical protein